MRTQMRSKCSLSNRDDFIILLVSERTKLSKTVEHCLLTQDTHVMNIEKVVIEKEMRLNSNKYVMCVVKQP